MILETSPQRCCCPEEGICTGSDAGNVRLTDSEDAGIFVRPVYEVTIELRVAKKPGEDNYCHIALTRIPTMRPNVAPMAIEGTKIPAGTFAPYETTTIPMRKIVAISRELAICHCTDVLGREIWCSVCKLH